MKEKILRQRNGKGVIAILFFVGIVIIFFVNFYRNQNIIMIGDEKIFVNVAKTKSEREEGLSGRRNLCDRCGMLFVFSEPGMYPFWMKDMYFDIDIIWLKNDKIVHFSRDLDHKNGIDERAYTPVEVDMALEVPAGFIEEKNLCIGQDVDYFHRAFE